MNEKKSLRKLTKQEIQEALLASEIRYRRLFESAKDGILILDSDTGKIEDVNPFLVKLLGYSRDQFISKAIWDIGFFKDIIANQKNFIELQDKKYVRYENLPLETADGRKIDIEFGLQRDNSQTIYFIKDNGVGFDMIDAERIFNPFIRLHSQKEFKGTGIGLAIAKRIVDKHHGAIWAQAEKDKGATFYFRLE